MSLEWRKQSLPSNTPASELNIKQGTQNLANGCLESFQKEVGSLAKGKRAFAQWRGKGVAFKGLNVIDWIRLIV